MGLELDELDLAPPGKPRVGQAVPIQSRAELLARFDEHVKVARAALAGASDHHLRGPWLLKVGGRTVSTKTRMMVMRGWVLSHLIHHRAQLGVYLRLLDLPVPMQYGPTADEGDMMG